MLKKIITLAAAVAVVSTSAFAMDITSAGTSIGGGTYKPSNGVKVELYTNGSSGQNDGTTYAAGAANGKGKKEYATNNSDPKIYSKAATTAGDPSVAASTWTPDNTWTAQ